MQISNDPNPKLTIVLIIMVLANLIFEEYISWYKGSPVHSLIMLTNGVIALKLILDLFPYNDEG